MSFVLCLIFESQKKNMFVISYTNTNTAVAVEISTLLGVAVATSVAKVRKTM